jgi:acetate---CoA ligase (ADP-forming)
MKKEVCVKHKIASMTKNRYKNLFSPQSIAIVGASNKKGKIGTIIADNILKLGYAGKTYLVNPSHKFLGFNRCYSSLSAIKKPIDLAIVCVPAKFVEDVVKDGMETVKNFVVISAGFSENSAEGSKREEQLMDLAKKHDLNILGPNCLGFIVPELKLNASFASGMPQEGNIAFVSQSGALAVALLDKAKEEHLGFSKVISIGNQMQIDESDLLEYLADDKDTKIIGMYLEGIKNGSRFLEIAKRISAKKPIVILKAGKTAKAQQAISSHTGALAGSDEIINVAFKSAGVIRADDLDDFFDLLGLISFIDAPENNRVAVVTNAGGAGVLTTDAFKGKEIALAEFNEKTKQTLAKQLPGEASVQNPIDLLGDAGTDRYQNALELLDKENPGSIICVLTPQQQTPVEEIAEVVITATAKKTNQTAIVTVFIGGERVKNGVLRLKQENIPNFSDPEKAVRALGQYYKWNIFRKKKENAEKSVTDENRRKNVSAAIEKARKQKSTALLFAEAAEIMRQYGIEAGRFWNILPGEKSPEIEEYPVVVKVDSDTVLHKSDKQGVILNIENSTDLENAVEKLRQNFPDERILIQPMQQKKTELILGIKKDDIFGPVVVYGLGGIYTEFFRMVDFLIPPMSQENIKEQVLSGKIGFLFQGARNQKTYDIEEFSKIIKGLMDFALENSDVSGLDINPLFIYNDGKTANAVDIKIII